MRLFLASAFDKTAKLLPEKIGSIAGKTILFVANASDEQTGDKWWIRIDREAFEKLGGKIKDLDLRTISPAELADQMAEAEIIHFCGGSVLYLISLLRDRSLAEPITDFIKQNKIIYTGTSAGSMIVSKDLTVEKYNPEEIAANRQNQTYVGLDLINFIIIPHASNPEFLEANVEVAKNLPTNTTPLLFLNDNHAVWVEDQKLEILKTFN